MARNNEEDRRHRMSNDGDDDFVVYKWEFPEPEEKQGTTKSFVARVVTVVKHFISSICHIGMK